MASKIYAGKRGEPVIPGLVSARTRHAAMREVDETMMLITPGFFDLPGSDQRSAPE